MLDGRRALIALLIGVALGAMGFGIAIAQDAAEDAEEQTSEAGDDEELPVRRRAQLSPEEQLAEATRIEERGTQISRRVLAMLDEARRERDIIRVTCLNDKLTQINAHRRTLESRAENLEDAINTGDESRRNHEFTVITVIGQHFRTLEQEASSCIGQDIFETGTTRVVTDIDPSTPDEDLIIDEPPGPVVPFIPPPASGML
ncbi:MAG TPA: hypothetical protein RMH99_11375 [Sandaracinaceae bacterium LLY-WYZ-13_1]|nr:hypothetical protein [Sandaracinaceae bacterium LLY-WYZ-13_1]